MVQNAVKFASCLASIFKERKPKMRNRWTQIHYHSCSKLKWLQMVIRIAIFAFFYVVFSKITKYTTATVMHIDLISITFRSSARVKQCFPPAVILTHSNTLLAREATVQQTKKKWSNLPALYDAIMIKDRSPIITIFAARTSRKSTFSSF